MVGMMKTKSELDIHTTNDIQYLGSFSVTDLLNLCKDQNTLLKDDDKLIERLTSELSEYEQELYEKDVYIKKLEDELRQAVIASNSKENLQ
jgi:hypothetical protein